MIPCNKRIIWSGLSNCTYCIFACICMYIQLHLFFAMKTDLPSKKGNMYIHVYIHDYACVCMLLFVHVAWKECINFCYASPEIEQIFVHVRMYVYNYWHKFIHCVPSVNVHKLVFVCVCVHMCVYCRSLRFDLGSSELSATEVTELRQENNTQYLYHFTFTAK